MLQYLAGIVISILGLSLLVLVLNLSFESRGKFKTLKNPTQTRTLDHRVVSVKSAFMWLFRERTGRVALLVWLSLTITVITYYKPQMLERSAVIQDPSDLRRVKVGTVLYSSSINYLKKLGIKNPALYETIDRGLTAVAQGEITAFVYDKPILNYFINQDEDSEVNILELQFEPQGYGIALPAGSHLREQINQVMLKRLSNETYIRKISEKHLGKKD